MLKVPPFKGSKQSDYFDFKIWERGIKKHQKASLLNGDERTYLRALHRRSTLNHLATFLKYKIPNAFLRLSSVWVDKNPQAHILDSNNKDIFNCEIGDLLIIVRSSNLNYPSSAPIETGWILQAKTALTESHICHQDSSTKNEINFYENVNQRSIISTNQRRIFSTLLLR